MNSWASLEGWFGSPINDVIQFWTIFDPHFYAENPWPLTHVTSFMDGPSSNRWIINWSRFRPRGSPRRLNPIRIRPSLSSILSPIPFDPPAVGFEHRDNRPSWNRSKLFCFTVDWRDFCTLWIRSPRKSNKTLRIPRIESPCKKSLKGSVQKQSIKDVSTLRRRSTGFLTTVHNRQAVKNIKIHVTSYIDDPEPLRKRFVSTVQINFVK